MSRIEEDAKPYLLTLINGDNTINRIGRRRISEWFFLKFAVQSIEAVKWTVHPCELREFMKHRAIPNAFKAWIFLHSTDEGRDAAQIQATRVEFTGATSLIEADHQNLSTYTQGFDRLLFFGMYAAKIPKALHFPPAQATKLYPLGDCGGIDLPSTALDNYAVYFLMNFLALNESDEGLLYPFLDDAVAAGKLLQSVGRDEEGTYAPYA